METHHLPHVEAEQRLITREAAADPDFQHKNHFEFEVQKGRGKKNNFQSIISPIRSVSLGRGNN